MRGFLRGIQIEVVPNGAFGEPQLWDERNSSASLLAPYESVEAIGPRLQAGAPNDLRVISWPLGQDFESLIGYTYLSEEQQLPWPRVRTVIIDNGFDQAVAVRDSFFALFVKFGVQMLSYGSGLSVL